MQKKPGNYSKSLVIGSDTVEGQRVQSDLLLAVQANSYSEHETFGVRLSMEEALVNAIKHGNSGDSSKKIRVDYTVTDSEIWIRIEDEGEGFDPESVPDPTSPEFLERPCGRGLMLMRHYMSEIKYEGRGNCVVMRKRKGDEPGDED